MDPTLVPALFDVLTVARTGSVAAAAERLHKTPSAVSQQIRRLTEALGVSLFERRGRGLVLTPAAERIIPEATRLFDQADAVFRLFSEVRQSAPTLLRLAASDYLARPLVVPVLRDLSAAGVPMHFEISTVHSDEALARVERGDVDLAIVSHVGERPSLSPRRLLSQPFYWVMPPCKRTQVRRTDRLAREPLLRLAQGSLGRRLLDRLLEADGVRPTSTIDVGSVSLLLAYVTGGVGIGLVPGLALQGLDAKKLVVERADVEPIAVQLVSRVGWKGGPVVLQFVDRLTDVAKSVRNPR